MSKRLSSTHEISRRTALGLAFGGSVAVAAAAYGLPVQASPLADEIMKKIMGGKSAADGGVKLDVPEIAENGNTVPVGFSVDSPMTKDDYIKSVHIIADGNPGPMIATFNFTPMSGKASASTRMRLAKTQNIIAIAEKSDGSLMKTSTQVKVTIGGCGG
ncbi:MAG: thiosulfate oxidation carrier protein SoxY [Hyphomicrobiales bacterium]|nr:MAG: thiosulfate oxidation carrier protein SoxY [Hyphomicrobiales bacterium]